MDKEDAVREALERIPASARALAKAAGISPATLSRIRSGERGVSAAIVERLADALAAWASECADAEQTLRQTLEEGES